MPTSWQYFNSLFSGSNSDWKLIYLLPRKISRTKSFWAFQYNILNNVLYLNKILFCFGKSPSPLCCFCKLHDETLIHLFSNMNRVVSTALFWIYTINTFVSKDCHFRLVKGNNKSILIQNIILMVIKLYVYKWRVRGIH